MRLEIFLRQWRAHPPSTFSSSGRLLPAAALSCTRGHTQSTRALVCVLRARAWERSVVWVCERTSVGTRDESLVRAHESPRRKEPPVKKRRERMLPEVVVNTERGGGGRSWPSWERLVRALVEREREKSRTRLESHATARGSSWPTRVASPLRRPLRPVAKRRESV